MEFAGNYPDVTRGPTDAQIAAWRVLVRVLRARYGIPLDHVYAHNWIDFKDARYCEGCALATMAREWGASRARLPFRRVNFPNKKAGVAAGFSSRFDPPIPSAHASADQCAASSAAASCFAIAPLTADCTFSKARTSI